jgi:hypothetical protein
MVLQIADEYLQCLKKNKSNADACKELSKMYLRCRMERYEPAETRSQCQAVPMSLHTQYHLVSFGGDVNSIHVASGSNAMHL